MTGCDCEHCDGQCDCEPYFYEIGNFGIQGENDGTLTLFIPSTDGDVVGY